MGKQRSQRHGACARAHSARDSTIWHGGTAGVYQNAKMREQQDRQRGQSRSRDVVSAPWQRHLRERSLLQLPSFPVSHPHGSSYPPEQNTTRNRHEGKRDKTSRGPANRTVARHENRAKDHDCDRSNES